MTAQDVQFAAIWAVIDRPYNSGCGLYTSVNVTSKQPGCDMRISRYASIDLYGLLLQAGIEIYEYNRTMLHQKTMVVDSTWATVGTTNFDPRSFSLDEESNVCVYDRRLAEKLESIFKEDLKHCDHVTLDEWRNRGIKTRVLGEVCVFLKEQI